MDFLDLASYGGGAPGERSRIRLLKDLDLPIGGRHVLLVEDVVDTGLTLNFLARTLALREPASLSAVTLLDRPYRRLVDDVPLDYVGFTVPDELFAGYGLGLDERWRSLPDLHVVAVEELPAHLDRRQLPPRCRRAGRREPRQGNAPSAASRDSSGDGYR